VATDSIEQLRAALAGRYEVERLVGQGGMAAVYLARDLRHGRQVAIKVLRAELALSIGADRFLREIRVAASLQHPNVLGLYDSGEAAGILYYVMPFVEGESLRDRLNREEQLPIHDSVRIAREAAEALAYAHQHGVIHRDIKPENIMLQNGHGLVADFGIARAVDAATGEKLTQTGVAVGTPHYMSPEQALGADHADGRSDIYSLGCVLYELLVGQPPFHGPNAMAILARHSMEAAPSLRVVRQSVPDELEDAVMRALEKTPADRFQSMQEFAEVLGDLEPVVAVRRTGSRGMPAVRRPSTGVGVRASRARRRLLGTAGAAVLVLAVLGWFAWRELGTGRSAPAAAAGFEPTRVAVTYFEARGGSDSLGYLADGLTEALIGELSNVKPLQVISPNGVRLYKDTNLPPDSIARALAVGTLVSGTLAQSGDRLRVAVSLANTTTGAEIGSNTIERPRAEIFALQDDLANEVAIFLRRRLGQEIRLAESRSGTSNPRAWELLQKGQEEASTADPLITAGDTAAALRQFARADSLLQEAERLDPEWPDPITARGWLAYRHSRLDPSSQRGALDTWTQRGLSHAERALALRPQDPDALELRGTLRYLRVLSNLEPDRAKGARLRADAERDLRAAVEADPTQASAWNVLSHLLLNQGEIAEGKLAALRAYEGDPYLTNVHLTLWRLASSSVDLADEVEARHWCEEGRRRFPKDPRFAECQILLMTLEGQTPDIPRAWQLLEEYVQLSPPDLREFRRREGQMFVATALARAGLADSAERVAVRAQGDASVDPSRDLALLEAQTRVVLGDHDGAFRLLSTYLAANPQQQAFLAKDQSWWFKDLREDPRWKTLATGRL
jgi:serine/threonine-protein kinase